MDEILHPLALPSLQTMGQGAVLQDDNIHSHRSHAVHDFLEQLISPGWTIQLSKHSSVCELNQLFQTLQQERQAVQDTL